MTSLFSSPKPPPVQSKNAEDMIVKPAPMAVDTTVSPAVRAEERRKKNAGSTQANRSMGGNNLSTTLGGGGGAYTA